jgi:hypothetical protein
MITLIGWYLALRYLFGMSGGGSHDFLFVPATPSGAPPLPAGRPAPALPSTSAPLSQSPAVAPWPSAAPSNLPPFPSGWEPDIPPPPEVVRRAVELLPGLWTKGVNNTQQELVGARWITFRAEWMGPKKGVVAYRVKGSSSSSAAARAPASSPAPAASAPMITRPSTTPRTIPVSTSPAAAAPADAAHALYLALADHGYNVADQPIYKAFQASQHLTADGFPGAGTIGKLKTALTGRGLPALNVKTYPWKSKPGQSGYDGVNAPTWAEWTRPVRGVTA